MKEVCLTKIILHYAKISREKARYAIHTKESSELLSRNTTQIIKNLIM